MPERNSPVGSADPSDSSDTPLGEILLELSLRVPEWVHRRVETVRLIDAWSVRRSVSVDFDVTELDGLPGIPDVIPLAYLVKEPLRDFNLRGESGETLPMLTKDQNGLHAFTSLLTYADALAGPSLPAEIVEDLRTIATEKTEVAKARLRHFETGITPLHTELMEDPTFEQLVNTFSRNFILLVDLSGTAPHRRVIKFSYTEALTWPERGFHRLPSNMGWVPTPFQFDVPSIAEAKSYHFEFTAPSGLGIIRAELSQTSREPTEVLYEDPEPLTETHLYTSDQLGGKAVATVWLEPFRSGLVRMSASAVAVNALILTLAYMRLDEVAKVATAGLLVALPGLIAASVSRPGEHAVVTEVLFGVRLVVGLSGLTALIAGLTLAGGFDPTVLERIWRALLALAWVAVLVIAPTYLEVGPLRRRFLGA